MIRTIIPILIGTKYMSATDVGVAVGTGVAEAAGATTKVDSELEGQ